MTEKKKRELLQQYITGKISPKNRHALEREAIEDVFLFEALEGYSKHMKSPDLPFYKTKPNTVLPIRTFMTMAASFLAIAAIAFLVKQNINPTINEEAMSEMKTEPNVSEDEIVSLEIPHEGNFNVTPVENKAGALGKKALEKSEQQFQDLEKRQENNTRETVKKTEEKQEVGVIANTANVETVVGLDSQDRESGSSNSEIPLASQKTIVASTEKRVDNREIASRRIQRPEISGDLGSSESQNKEEKLSEELSETIVNDQDSTQKIIQETEFVNRKNGFGDTITSSKAFQEENSTKKHENQLPLSHGIIYVSELPHKKPHIYLSDRPVGPTPSKSGYAIQGIRYSPEEINASDSGHSHNYRKVFPVRGWNEYNKELEQLKKEVSCEGMSFTFKFQILESGHMYDLELTQLPSIDQTGLVLECLVKTKSFIEGYGKWETVPPNRKVNRKLTIDFDE